MESIRQFLIFNHEIMMLRNKSNWRDFICSLMFFAFKGKKFKMIDVRSDHILGLLQLYSPQTIL